MVKISTPKVPTLAEDGSVMGGVSTIDLKGFVTQDEDQVESQIYKVYYLPVVAGLHTVQVKYSPVDRSLEEAESKKDVMVRAGKLDPSRCHAEGQGLTKALAQVPAEFQVTLRDSYGNPLADEDIAFSGLDKSKPSIVFLISRTVTIQDPVVRRVKAGVYAVTYMVPIAIRVDVHVKVPDPLARQGENWVLIKGTPTSFEVEAPAEMKQCRQVVMSSMGSATVQICQACFQTRRNKCHRCQRVVNQVTSSAAPRYCTGCGMKWKNKCLHCKQFIHFGGVTPSMCPQCAIAESTRCSGFL